MASLSVQQAQAIIDELQTENGGMNEEERNQMTEQMLKKIRKLQTLAGGSIEHVAEDLYDADTRFIFELLQNAEDNRYTIAAERQEAPFVHFTLHNDYLTVDSNENGFNEADVRSICSIHQSSKQQSGGYIGHKGIGFKSVFKIAYKVDIQSGPFCFYFEYRRGDGGMAMITPYIQAPQELPFGVQTRITLWLLDTEEFLTRASELQEIPDTLLLFLRKLQVLKIEIPTLQYSVSYQRREDVARHLVTLSKHTGDDEQTRFYHTQKTTLSNLPEHHSRLAQDETDLILAFPVDDSLNPIIEPQFVYSFLPMRREGFSFLIQSDFITQASRQGVLQCARNYAIRAAICGLFAQAVEYFCSHEVLAYEWLQYLPSLQIHDSFWGDLREMIFDTLRDCKVLFCRTNNVLKLPEELQRLSTKHCDRHGHPLLEDIYPETYLSQSYAKKHDENLRELGVDNLSFHCILDRLDPYLQGDSPKYLDPVLDDDWHTKIADLLIRAIKTDNKRGDITKRIKSMPLIPASRGGLMSAESPDVYFPTDHKGNVIPEDLPDMPTVDQIALDNPSRRTLFKTLGVTHCHPTRVIQSILKRYNKHDGVTLEDSVSHIAYLFRALEKNESLDKRIFIMDRKEIKVYRAFPTFGVPIIKDDLYVETLGDYGTKHLAEVIAQNSRKPETPGFDIHLIHSAYIDSVPAATLSHGRTFSQWLEEVAYVRRTPRLKHLQHDRLSDLSAYLAKYHPMDLICLLKENWERLQTELTPQVIDLLRRMKVPSLNTQESLTLNHELRETYYPSQEMQQLCSITGVEQAFTLFLNIPSSSATEDGRDWGFLATLGVTFEPDLYFFSIVMKMLSEGYNEEEPSSKIEAATYRIYRELSLRFPNEGEDVCDHIFWAYPTVFIPASSRGSASFAHFEDCVWGGLPCLPKSLAQYPQYANDPHICHLFKNMLQLPDAGLAYYISSLRSRKYPSLSNKPEVLMEDLYAIYGTIADRTKDPDDKELVLKEFSRWSLVYLPEAHRWLAPESCLWTETSKIGSQFGISKVYPELEDFFRRALKVQVPTVATYIVQLRDVLSTGSASIDDIKDIIHKVNILPLEAQDRENLLDLKFLPVVLPERRVVLLSPTESFFIADRTEHRSAFEGKVPFLDFSLEETRQLHRLLLFLGLETRYTSAAVREKTVVESPEEQPSPTETRAFQKKAGHILRCALHYNATRLTDDTRKELENLQKAVVSLSGGFQRTLELRLNEVSATVQSDTGLVHIKSGQDELQIYVPRDSKDRQRCYILHLPHALVRHFVLRDAAASMMLQLIFTTGEDIIDALLDNHGIIGLPSDIRELAIVQGGSLFEDNDTLVNATLNTPRLTSQTREELAEFEVISHHRRAVSPSPQPVQVERFDSEPTSPHEFTPYVQLLDQVISMARQMTLTEALQRQPPTLSNQPIFAYEQMFGVRSDNQTEHDIKIGAAGELFVFELLLKHGLPGFTAANWRSRIRKRVSVHPEYHTLVPWSGVETADIVYPDTNSELTSALVGMGHMLAGLGFAAAPTYYIEVKTTTGEWDNAFFMSKSQYRRMERMSIPNNLSMETISDVYIILRVYNLGKDNMRACIYIDPESLRQDGRLIFQPETYTVSPGISEPMTNL